MNKNEQADENIIVKPDDLWQSQVLQNDLFNQEKFHILMEF